MENRKELMRGMVMTGSLYGDWENVKIANGNLSMEKQFTKYPR